MKELRSTAFAEFLQFGSVARVTAGTRAAPRAGAGAGAGARGCAGTRVGGAQVHAWAVAQVPDDVAGRG